MIILREARLLEALTIEGLVAQYKLAEQHSELVEDLIPV